MTARTRAQVGRAARTKGIRAERALAAYLRANGWPKAERKSDTGWRASDRDSPDHGDVRNTDRLAWQCKARGSMSTLDVERALADATDQAVNAGADFGVLVVRRDGKANPGDWWSWLPVGDLCALAHPSGTFLSTDGTLNAPARVLLRDLVALLHRAGYGDQP